MRRNPISWLTDQVPAAQHAIALTHNINFLFVQGVLSARLRAAGNPRLTIFADANCATSAWRHERALLDGLGVRYRVVPVELGPWRRFHPKALLLAGTDRAALAVGSGNLTWGGMAANHEAWAFGVSDGEGAPLVSAFRDYVVETLVPLLPMPEHLREIVGDIFGPDQIWARALPAPSGLVGSPSATPLLDQIASRATDKVRAVTVLSPYHDADGVALGEIARRWPVPVTCWMQAGHEGLSRTAAAGLPSNVAIVAIEVPEARRPSFIHAKVLAFHRDDDVLLAIGSANCSKAALLAAQGAGNAELMALDAVSHADAEALLAELIRTQAELVLPELPPEEDWPEQETVAFRILAARQAAGELEIAFRSTEPISNVAVHAPEGAWQVAIDQGIARAKVPVRLRVVRLSGNIPSGAKIESPEAWVDDELSLAAPAGFRRMLNKVSEAESPDADPGQAFHGILEAFRDYLRDPEASRRRMTKRDDRSEAPRAYDPNEVFAEDFGRLGVPLPRGAQVSREPVSILAIIEALFSVSREVATPPQRRPPPTDEELANNTASVDPEPLPPPTKWVLHDRAKAQLRRALRAVQGAVLDDDFVNARSPALLGADLALVAILLVKGLAVGLLERDDYRDATRRLWAALFFGELGEPGGLLARISALGNADAEQQFLVEISSPRLSAALALWSMTEWTAGDAEAVAFRLAAARLQLAHPWLFAGAPPELLVAEVVQLAEALLPPNEQAIAPRIWVEIVRAGEALRVLSAALTLRSPEELRAFVKSETLGPQDVVWVNGRLALPIHHTRRDPNTNIELRFLGEAATRKFKGGRVVPVRELVERSALGLSPAASTQILDLISAAATIFAHASS